MNIVITEKPSEMIMIAKSIIEERRDYYTSEVLEDIRNEIEHHIGVKDEDILFQAIYYYWTYGATTDELFYLHLLGKTFDEIKKYITKREKVIYTNQLNCLQDAHYLQNKYETYEMFKSYYKRELIICDDKECFGKFLDYVNRHPVFVVKPLKLGGGKGIHKESTIGLSTKQIYNMYNNLLEETKLIHRKLDSWGGASGFVVEEVLDQADELASFHQQSVNVVRVPTLNIHDDIIVYQPWLKTGTGDSFVDNAHSGGLLAGIDADTGIIDTNGVSEIPVFYETHPDSNVRFVGFQIPQWNELIRIAKELSQQLPSIKYISWDLALTKKGWALVEGNFRGEFDWQMFRQRGMKFEFEQMTGLTINKKFWWQ